MVAIAQPQSLAWLPSRSLALLVLAVGLAVPIALMTMSGTAGSAQATAAQANLASSGSIEQSSSGSSALGDAGTIHPPTSDPMLSTPGWSITGEAAGSLLGYSVANVGDVNGDGYSDVAVGARGYGSNQGRVYVYHGGPAGLSPSPALTLTGQAANDWFGVSVAGAGDVNGDGYADLVVGAAGYNGNQGRVYVYLGGPAGLSPSPALTLTGQAASDEFGISVARAGDVNGDGYPDLLIGAAGYNGNQGRVYVYLGGPAGLSPSPALTLTGQAANDEFGGSVAGAGDVNGDGFADLVVGAAGYNANQGRVYVYLGGPGGLSPTPALTLAGQATGDWFGTSVARAGDVNSDGFADVIVGAPGYPSGSNQGRAYVYHGGPGGLSATPAATLTGQGNNDWFGTSVAGAGDVDGDGFADLVVGAYGYSGGSNQGRVYVYHGGSAGLSPTPVLTLTGQASNDWLGISVAGAGDVNGDGFADLVVGASGSNGSRGRADIFLGGPAALSPIPGGTATGEATGDNFSYSVASAGDVNGDGYADVIVGAYGYPAGSNRGRAYVYYGGPAGLSTTPAVTVVSQDDGDYFGYSVASAGDVNGDGYADVVVGAWAYVTGTAQGRVYVYYGGSAGLSPTPAVTLTGEAATTDFGVSVTSADLNGDGYSDLVVGADGYNNYRGRVYIYYGGRGGLSPTPSLTLTGEAGLDEFGLSIASAGDINGDGYPDLLIGASGYSTSTGRVYVYHGGPSGLSPTPALTLTGEAANDWFGTSVAGAGDVNSDGYADVVIGANGYPVGTNQGRAYVYLGGPTGLRAAPALTLTGEAASDWFGTSVSGAGDVNGDGYADVVVGTPSYPSFGNQGRAYVYLGSQTSLSASPALTLTGDASGSSFGVSVASAGDLNGDGYPDFVIGASGYPSGTNQGRAYAFLGSDSGGRSVLVRQLTGDGRGRPLQAWGQAGATDRFQVEVRVGGPIWRQRVKLEIQACPAGTPFGSAGCTTYTAPSWTDVTTPTGRSVTLTETVAGLSSGTLYHWRARVLYAPQTGTASQAHPAYGPWRRPFGQAEEGDFWTGFAGLASPTPTSTPTAIPPSISAPVATATPTAPAPGASAPAATATPTAPPASSGTPSGTATPIPTPTPGGSAAPAGTTPPTGAATPIPTATATPIPTGSPLGAGIVQPVPGTINVITISGGGGIRGSLIVPGEACDDYPMSVNVRRLPVPPDVPSSFQTLLAVEIDATSTVDGSAIHWLQREATIELSYAGLGLDDDQVNHLTIYNASTGQILSTTLDRSRQVAIAQTRHFSDFVLAVVGPRTYRVFLPVLLSSSDAGW